MIVNEMAAAIDLSAIAVASVSSALNFRTGAITCSKLRWNHEPAVNSICENGPSHRGRSVWFNDP
jgi:hypothetical protein